MFYYYNIVGLVVKMESDGITLHRAKPYLTEPTDHVDIEILRQDVQPLIEKNLAKFPDMPYDDLVYLSYSTHFYSLLSLHGGLMVHSSAVVVDNKAYLFTADPGTGKSTHTELWLKLFGDRAYILNDDKPALKIEDGVIYAYGSPWSGKNDISRNVGVPLAGIAVLERGKENVISKCELIDVLNTMVNQILHSSKPDRMATILDLMDNILSQAQIWRLQCNMDLDAAVVSYEAMSGKKFE